MRTELRTGDELPAMQTKQESKKPTPFLSCSNPACEIQGRCTDGQNCCSTDRKLDGH